MLMRHKYFHLRTAVFRSGRLRIGAFQCSPYTEKKLDVGGGVVHGVIIDMEKLRRY